MAESGQKWMRQNQDRMRQFLICLYSVGFITKIHRRHPQGHGVGVYVNPVCGLADEEQFAVLWQRPHVVVDHLLKFVDRTADGEQ